jgi:hypothetical protein
VSQDDREVTEQKSTAVDSKIAELGKNILDYKPEVDNMSRLSTV